jgi:antirestriction protein ArdC
MSTKTSPRRRTTAEREEMQAESLSRAIGGQSALNYETILREFIARGIPAGDITPRENVFTFNAWRALGRTVKRGEKGVAIISFVPMRRKERDPSTGETTTKEGARPTTSHVFHISQTEPLTK